MSHVMYKAKRLIPAPFISLNKDFQTSGDGTPIGTVFTITVQGTIVTEKGSPNSQGVLWDQPGFPPDETIPEDSRLGAVIRKVEAIRELFSEHGHQFEVQSADGTQPLKCNPRVVSVQMPEGLWNSILTYTIVLEADVVYINGTALGEDDFTSFITDAQESWQFETDETPEGFLLPRTYRLSHSISATGKRFFDDAGALTKQAWEQARDYVLPRLGFDAAISLNSGVNNLPSYYNGYNHVRSSSQDDLGGTYSVTESWILTSGKAIEEFDCSIKQDAGAGITSVSINGTVTGLEERGGAMELVSTKYSNANTRFTSIQPSILTRAQNYTGLTLNPIPLSQLVGRNEINGSISYSYEYDTRPSNIFSGVTMENITISEQFAADLFAIIPCIGRTNGPVLQNLGSTTERSVSLNIELALQPNSFGAGSVSEVRAALYTNPRVSQPNAFNTLINAAQPQLQYGTNLQFIRSKQESFDVKNGRYTFSIEWIHGN